MGMPLRLIVTLTGFERRPLAAVTQPRSGRSASGMLADYTYPIPSLNKSVTGA